MSRIGKKPIAVPQGVTVTVQGTHIAVKGSKGELARELPSFLKAAVKDGQLTITCSKDDQQAQATFGTTRSILANMIEGVTKGYVKDLEIQGVGFKASLQGKKLVMSVGYSHPVEYMVPDGVKCVVNEGTAISISGPDKQLVGQVGARIRAFCPPEPYKGKGVRFKGEHVRRKVGKTVA
jgi:large subunit ribosomal protein L6